MVIYSYSKINTFKSCPLKFKFNYLDKLQKDFTNSIEAIMGTAVHETLEKLYKDLQHGKENSLKSLLDFYKKEWDKRIDKDVKIVKQEYNEKNYFQKGKKHISDYYASYTPFDQDYTVGLEQQISLTIEGYSLTGYIDRLALKKDGAYVIHDYKTSGTLPTTNNIEDDKQLALYSMAIKEKYPDAHKIELVWHYLAFGKEIRITKTDESLTEIKKDIAKWIEKIESEKEFGPKESALCDWCEYASKCPKRKHLFETKQMNLETFSSDLGVKLVDKYTELSILKSHIAEQINGVEQELEKYADREKIDNINGTNSVLKISTDESLKLPSKTSKEYKELKEDIIKRGFLELIDINGYYVDKNLEKLPDDLKAKIQQEATKRESKRFRVVHNSGSLIE